MFLHSLSSPMRHTSCCPLRAGSAASSCHPVRVVAAAFVSSRKYPRALVPSSSPSVDIPADGSGETDTCHPIFAVNATPLELPAAQPRLDGMPSLPLPLCLVASCPTEMRRLTLRHRSATGSAYAVGTPSSRRAAHMAVRTCPLVLPGPPNIDFGKVRRQRSRAGSIVPVTARSSCVALVSPSTAHGERLHIGKPPGLQPAVTLVIWVRPCAPSSMSAQAPTSLVDAANHRAASTSARAFHRAANAAASIFTGHGKHRLTWRAHDLFRLSASRFVAEICRSLGGRLFPSPHAEEREPPRPRLVSSYGTWLAMAAVPIFLAGGSFPVGKGDGMLCHP